jgi:uncharacterized protein (TIGR01777 family)
VVLRGGRRSPPPEIPEAVKIAISGASGLIGSLLAEKLQSSGAEVLRLVRPSSKASASGGSIAWDPARGEIDRSGIAGAEAIVHLAGENIADGRWTEERKRSIRESRIRGARLIAETIAEQAVKPRVLVSASAVGFYGDRGDEILDEASAMGAGFLPELCRDWEGATEPASRANVRVVCARIGVVIGRGGALSKMLGAFRLGLGGRLGDGRQWMSWIALEDAVDALIHVLDDQRLRGPVNLTAPSPVTNADFTRALSRALHRPAFLAVPRTVLRIALGEMADEAALASARVIPKALLGSDFAFRHADLEAHLARIVGR